MSFLPMFLLLCQLIHFSSVSAQKPTVSPLKFFRKDYRYYDKMRSFYKLHTTHRNWLEAKRRCSQEGAMLWYPENQEELDFMVKYWQEEQPSEPVLFVGITDQLSEGNFETIDGKPVEDVWSIWGTGEPNNDPLYGGENCVALQNINGGINLNDENCERSAKPFICKKTLATLEWNIPCDMPDKSYMYDKNFGKCYKFHRKLMTWTEAYGVCLAEQSYLAIINSKKEKEFLVNITANAKTEKIPKGSKYVHLGFQKRFDEGWHTVAGLPLEDVGWIEWAKDQPDGRNKEKCGAMSFEGLLNDIDCAEKAFFICEHEIGLLRNAIDERLGN